LNVAIVVSDIPIGVLGLLVRAKQRGLVALVEPLLDQLENDLGFFISGSLGDRQEMPYPQVLADLSGKLVPRVGLVQPFALRAEVLRLAGEFSHP
jgi:hypothetical protein